ncbi:uncharacterized protein B0H64DRAFT_427854 [Chaetomium fimeti]|uniref:ATP-grasp domain-containing protein n=1 Tax=Chaetomium fimeti TaxID=1854472 RepID=A0AAE0H5M3_9PEZI|nr:hypothetical protein B0H64DRAFT_427854 [Chaetomium fimeti]
MVPVGPRTLAGIKLPTVKLDTTLTELYQKACPNKAGTRLGWISCGVTSAVDLTPDFPRNTKFIYQDQAFIKASSHALREGNANLRRSLANKYLSHIPQRDAFVSGKAVVILFNLGRTPEQVEHGRREAEDTISVLDPSQRPELIFCPGPSDIPVKEHGIDRLEYKVVLDGLDKYPLTHDLETHWMLNSKAALARSGLPTPKSDLIETPHPPPSRRLMLQPTTRILDAVRARPTPFVFKTQQAFGGAGTWLVTTDAQKSQLLADLGGKEGEDRNPERGNEEEDEPGLLARLLPLLTPHNAHLSPTTVLLTDLITNPTSDHGLTFTVAPSGAAHFLGASSQMLTAADGSSSNNSSSSSSGSAWVGSTIAYAAQGPLRARFAPLVGRIARWVAARGYAGPVGADVLEDGEGRWFVVDLNVRTCGSVSLPLLRGHFTGRGLMWASCLSVAVGGGRREFVERWRGELERGRMVVLSWCEDREEGGSIADVVVGGEDEDRLRELMGRVRASTEEMTF